MDDTAPGELDDALRLLAKSVSSENVWMIERAGAYKRGHSADPQSWPPPVSVDWLWVDLGTPGEGASQEIEAPPYAARAS
jgi:hypothetical protein